MTITEQNGVVKWNLNSQNILRISWKQTNQYIHELWTLKHICLNLFSCFAFIKVSFEDKFSTTFQRHQPGKFFLICRLITKVTPKVRFVLTVLILLTIISMVAKRSSFLSALNSKQYLWDFSRCLGRCPSLLLQRMTHWSQDAFSHLDPPPTRCSLSWGREPMAKLFSV